MSWRRAADFGFASAEAALPLIGAELARAAVHFPIAFARERADYTVVALCGVDPGRNLFVSADGKWIPAYTPAGLRSHPFAMRRDAAGQLVLCVQESNLEPTEGAGEPLFSPTGELSEDVDKITQFLRQVEQGRAQTAPACAALARHNCIAPLAFSFKTDDGERPLEGLFQVNESVLNGLTDEAFLELRKTGALALAYAHLLSLQKLPLLGEMAALRAAEDARQRSALEPFGGVDLSMLDKDGTFGLDALR